MSPSQRGEVDVTSPFSSSERVGGCLLLRERRGDEERKGGHLLPEPLLLRSGSSPTESLQFYFFMFSAEDVMSEGAWSEGTHSDSEAAILSSCPLLYRRGYRPSPSLYQDNKHIEVGNTAWLDSAFFTRVYEHNRKLFRILNKYCNSFVTYKVTCTARS